MRFNQRVRKNPRFLFVFFILSIMPSLIHANARVDQAVAQVGQ